MQLPSWAIPVIVLAIIGLLRVGAWQLIDRLPRLALALIEPWYLSAICVVALSTQLILYVTINFSTLFPMSTTGQSDAIKGALIGAITAYLAVLWTDDIKKAEGPLLPSGAFKSLVQTTFATLLAAKTRDNGALWEAIHDERTTSDQIVGWGFKARWRRAAVLAQAAKSGVLRKSR